MNMRTKLVVAFFFLLFCLAGCDNINLFKANKVTKGQKSVPVAPVVKGTIIARVNNAPITLTDLNQEVEAYNSVVPATNPEAKITTHDQKVNYLKEEMVKRELLYQEALARGLDRKEEIVQALEKTKQQLLVMELVRQEADKIDVSAKEIEDYYNQYKDQLKDPEKRQLREIVVTTEQEAKDVLVQLLQGADFATLARERSKSASAKNGGDLGFLEPGKKSPQFDAVVFSDTLEVGKVSNIFKGADGYYIVKLEAKSGGKQKSLSDLWEDIKRGLIFVKQQKRIEDLITKLSRESKLEVYEGEVK